LRIFAPFLLAGIFIAGAPHHANAWGLEGHRIVAALAYERLTPTAKRAIEGLIALSAAQDTPTCPVHSLEDASTWPDCVRSLRRFGYLTVMHYEDVPICGLAVKSVYCPDGRCITEETRRAIVVLKDTRRPPGERIQALEEITHLIGDLHQPLHAADNNDRGGNEVRVQVGGHETNLHHVWDDEVLVAAVGPSEVEAENALRPLIRANAAAWSDGDLDHWLAQSHRLAVSYVYPKLVKPPSCNIPAPPQSISQAYLDKAAPIVRIQLARASLRLSSILNRALAR
jgi:hypothetical protein